jgi:hypothetical protein
MLEYKMFESPDYPEFELVRRSLSFLVKENRSRILGKYEGERERKRERERERERERGRERPRIIGIPVQPRVMKE